MGFRIKFELLLSQKLSPVSNNFTRFRRQVGKEDTSNLPALIVFYSPGCHSCIYAKNEIMPGIELKFKGKISVEYRDIDNIENYKLLLGLEEKYHPVITNDFPVFFFSIIPI